VDADDGNDYSDYSVSTNASSAGYAGIGIGGFFILAIMFAICRIAMRRSVVRMIAQRQSTSTQSLLAPERIVTDASSPGKPL